MMKEITLNSWNEFEQKITALEFDQYGKYIENQISRSPFLFRGQGDSTRKLKTTLDRYFSKEVSLNTYYRLTLIAKPRIETFTNNRWDAVPNVQSKKTIHITIQIMKMLLEQMIKSKICYGNSIFL